jgi:hypothetical protein
MEAGCLSLFAFVLFAIVLALALRAQAAAARAQEETTKLRTTIDVLGRRVSELRVLVESLQDGSAAEHMPRGVDDAPHASSEPAVAAYMASVPAEPRAPSPIQPPLPAPVTILAAPPEPPPISHVDEPVRAAGTLDTPHAYSAATAFAADADPEPAERFDLAPPPPPPPSPPKARATAAAGRLPRAMAGFDWESLVGVKLFSWIAGVALVLAAVFFLKYSVEHSWIGPKLRATIGLTTGLALLAVCELKLARQYRWTVAALDGAGIAILYATLFATHALWHLVPNGVVFGGMIVVTALAVWLSLRRDSMFVALLGLVGGFATPALLTTGENRPIGLFSYLLLLNAGLAWVAYKKRWPALTALSLVLTVLYQWLWVGKFLSGSQFPIAIGVFAAFAIGSAVSLWLAGARESTAERQSFFERTAAAGALLPLFFATYSAAVPAYGSRVHLLFAFVLLLDAAIAFIALTRGPRWMHLAAGLWSVLSLAIWFGKSYAPSAYPAVLAWIVAIALFYLAVHLFAARRTLLDAFSDRAVYVAALVLFAFPLLAAMEKSTASPLLLFAVLFALLAAIAACAIASRRGKLWYLAAFFGLAAEGVWTANSLTRERLPAALALYAIFGALFVAVPVVARRFNRALEPQIGAAAVLLGAVALLFMPSGSSFADAFLPGLGALLLLANMAMVLEARAVRRPWWQVAANTLSWLVFAVWWINAHPRLEAGLSLTLIVALGVAAVAGALFAQREQRDRSVGAMHLALSGYLFLLVVASDSQLLAPLWMPLAALLLLDLVIAAGTLYTRRGDALVPAVVLSQIVLCVAGATLVKTSPIPLIVASLATTLIAVAANVFVLLRRGEKTDVAFAQRWHSFAAAVAAALLTGELFATLLGAHEARVYAFAICAFIVVQQAALFITAGATRWHHLAVIGVASGAAMTAAARYGALGDGTLASRFALAAIVYMLTIAYPLLLGRRIERSIQPHLTAIVGTLLFFFFAREDMLAAGFGGSVGLLPLALGAVLALLLWQLLRIEAALVRMQSRLALVSATILACISVAIPLQFDKEWITIGWALEGAALIWLFRKIPHRGLLAWSAALLAAVFVRLALNPALLDYHARSNVRIFNWYFYTYAVCAAAMFAAAALLPDRESREQRIGGALASSAGTILLFLLVNIEIADFWSTGTTLTFQILSASLKQDLTYTIVWALFAIALLVAGLLLRARGARVAAIVLLLVTVLKCFLHDLARLGGLYRVGSLLGLALSLVIVGMLLQRFVIQQPEDEATTDAKAA